LLIVLGVDTPDRKGRVLVVDDDVRTARLLARMLEEDGFDVEVSSDGARAIGRLSRSPAIDMLLTDLHMPHADGLTVARYARSLNPTMPVFIVTGYPEMVTNIESALAPVARVFAKPVAYPELTAAMAGSLTR